MEIQDIDDEIGILPIMNHRDVFWVGEEDFFPKMNAFIKTSGDRKEAWIRGMGG